MMKLEDFSYTNEKGDLVHGTAALIHKIFTDCDGLDDFMAKYGTCVIVRPVIKKKPNANKIVSLFKKCG